MTLKNKFNINSQQSILQIMHRFVTPFPEKYPSPDLKHHNFIKTTQSPQRYVEHYLGTKNRNMFSNQSQQIKFLKKELMKCKQYLKQYEHLAEKNKKLQKSMYLLLQQLQSQKHRHLNRTEDTQIQRENEIEQLRMKNENYKQIINELNIHLKQSIEQKITNISDSLEQKVMKSLFRLEDKMVRIIVSQNELKQSFSTKFADVDRQQITLKQTISNCQQSDTPVSMIDISLSQEDRIDQFLTAKKEHIKIIQYEETDKQVQTLNEIYKNQIKQLEQQLQYYRERNKELSEKNNQIVQRESQKLFNIQQQHDNLRELQHQNQLLRKQISQLKKQITQLKCYMKQIMYENQLVQQKSPCFNQTSRTLQ